MSVIQWFKTRESRARKVEVVTGSIAVLVLLMTLTGIKVLSSHPQSAGISDPAMTLELTPGPYFVGELIEARLTLTNRSSEAYMLPGPERPNGCGSAIFVVSSGGHAPLFSLPLYPPHIHCPLYATLLKPGQTLTIRELLPLSASGRLRLMARASPLTTRAQPIGITLPAITISVEPQVPSDRTIALHLATSGSGTVSLQVSAPAGARGALYSLSSVVCRPLGGPIAYYFAGESTYWHPLPEPQINEPACVDGGVPSGNWTVSVAG
jgi:hypothetical protein